MKIYRREEFLKLPAGTLYYKSIVFDWESLFIKEDSLENDWYFSELNMVDFEDSSDILNKQKSMLNKGMSYPLSDCITRDGNFEEADIFLVMEREDVLKLKGYIENSLERAYKVVES